MKADRNCCEWVQPDLFDPEIWGTAPASDLVDRSERPSDDEAETTTKNEAQEDKSEHPSP